MALDEPLEPDVNAAGTTAYAVARRSGGFLTWYISDFSQSFLRIQEFGLASDILAPGDYDGDGIFDISVRRGSGSDLATFYMLQSTAGYREQQWGFGSDFVVPGDYDGDGRTDLTALRQGTNYTWYIFRSSDSVPVMPQIGQKPDFAIQGDYDGDGKTDIAAWDQVDGIFRSLRSTTGVIASEPFGLNGDFPVAAYDTH